MSKTVLITGSNRGIGNAIVHNFAQNGHNIIAHSRKQTESFEIEMQTLAENNNVNIKLIYFDMKNSEAMKVAIKGLIKEGIQIDILINCVGIAHAGLFQMTTMQTIRDVFDVNFFSHLDLTQLLLRQMVKRKSGCIVNISSIAGMDFEPGNCAYGTSKAAIIAWTRTLAAEIAQFGIRVNAVAPGLTNTELAKQMGDKAKEDTLSCTTLKRLANPEEIADVVAYLASEKSSYINGQIIRVDGGLR